MIFLLLALHVHGYHQTSLAARCSWYQRCFVGALWCASRRPKERPAWKGGEKKGKDVQGTFGEAWDWAALQTSSALACTSGTGCVKLCQTCQSARVLTEQAHNTGLAQQRGDRNLKNRQGAARLQGALISTIKVPLSGLHEASV